MIHTKQVVNQQQLTDVPRAVMPQPVPEGTPLDHPSLYFNKELGWIDFNWRVLYLALDERTPLLERVRFLAIAASNLDEFCQKRVGGLKRVEAAGVDELSPDGRSPSEQLALLHEAMVILYEQMVTTWEETLRPALVEEANIHIRDYETLTEMQREALHQHFVEQIYPVLTPLAVTSGLPFPFISNLSLSLAVWMRQPEQENNSFARIKIPLELGRWVAVPQDEDEDALHFLPLEQLVREHVAELLPGMEVLSVHPFRVTRNADVNRDEEVADDLLAMISEELQERKFAPVVRLEVVAEMPAEMRDDLVASLEIGINDVYSVDTMLDLTGCYFIANQKRPFLQYPPWEPIVSAALRPSRPIMERIRERDRLIHLPYDSYRSSVQRLLEEAATDPQVLAIKMTLYRTAGDSPTVNALLQAAQNGKQVAVLIEVKARFDEANNIEWGRTMEDAGIHVTYGLAGLKTHSKVMLIVRREGDEICTYTHIGTGNYHAGTARLYTDLGLLTCDPVLGRDVVNLFHYLTGNAPNHQYEEALVAPRDMRERFYKLIEQEIAHQEAYGSGRIIVKSNALDDRQIIQRLYKASQAGVTIDLIIRGHVRIRPGLPGYSENIRVISILGRFLEHDRTFYFHNNGSPKYFIGSADWRNRNLSERVELIAPVKDPLLQERLRLMLDAALQDNRLAWDCDADGQYTLRRPAEGEPVRNFHHALMALALRQRG